MLAERRDLGRVLVTGAAGFLGAALVQELRGCGADVVASDLTPETGGAGEVQSCDITDFDRVDALVRRQPIGTIIHCGAVSGPMVMADRPLDIWRINALGSAHVLEAARRAGVGRVVLCSTTEIYGSRGGLVDEETLPKPNTIYGASKVAAEQALLGYRFEHDIDAVAVRLSWIYGPGRKTPTLLERLLRDGIAGRPTALDGCPADVTHYLFVDDAVQGLLCAAMARRTHGWVYNVTAGEGSTLAQTVEIVRSVLPCATATFRGTVRAAGGPSGFDQTKAAAEITYAPRVSFESGVRRYIKTLAHVT